MPDSTPGQVPSAHARELGADLLSAVPPPPPEPGTDTRPKRPTTRAGRAAAAAARKAEGKAESKPKQPTSKPRKASLETRLTGSLVSLGMVVAASGSVTSPTLTADGVMICEHAPNIAAALDKVAKDDPRVAAALERVLTAGVWSGLFAAVLPLAVGIAANHGALPASVAGMLGAALAGDQPEPEPTPGPAAPGTAGIV